jgi:hypothetical protein
MPTLTLLTLALILAACGANQTLATTPTAQETAAPTPAPEPPRVVQAPAPAPPAAPPTTIPTVTPPPTTPPATVPTNPTPPILNPCNPAVDGSCGGPVFPSDKPPCLPAGTRRPDCVYVAP